jgi:hypothetical protein
MNNCKKQDHLGKAHFKDALGHDSYYHPCPAAGHTHRFITANGPKVCSFMIPIILFITHAEFLCNRFEFLAIGQDLYFYHTTCGC